MTELRIERVLPAAKDRVWRAFTDARELGAWFWPGSWQTTGVLDLRVGGRYRLESAVSGMALSGEFVAIEPEHRLVQTWRWDGDDHETLVTVTLEPVEAGTALTIVHERFVTADDRDNHAQGWNDCLDRLPGYLGA